MANNRRYTFKLHPDPWQENALRDHCRLVGQLWNALLHMQEEQYRRTRGQRGVCHGDGGVRVVETRAGRHTLGPKSHLSGFDMGYLVSELLACDPEWQALSTWTPRRVADALAKAFDAFFRRAKQGAGSQSGYPRFRSYRRGEQTWLPHRFASGCKLTHQRGTRWALRLKGVDGDIVARGKFPGDPTKLTDADIRWHSGAWWLSVGCQIERARDAGDRPLVVVLDGIDSFARVNGLPVLASDVGLPPPDRRIESIQQRMAELPRGSVEYAALRRQKARLEARAGRQRREALHEWTSRLVAGASAIDLLVPADLSGALASGRGDQYEWGGAVELKASFNRAVLAQGLSGCAAMIEYKAAEAGIPLTRATHDALSVGNLAVENRKASRRVRRQLQECAA